jgi:hypothetical protein
MRAPKDTHKYVSGKLYYPTQDGRYRCPDTTQQDYLAQIRNDTYLKHYVLQKNADRIPGARKYFKNRQLILSGGTWHYIGTNRYDFKGNDFPYLTYYVVQRSARRGSER